MGYIEIVNSYVQMPCLSKNTCSALSKYCEVLNIHCIYKFVCVHLYVYQYVLAVAGGALQTNIAEITVMYNISF